MSSADVDMCALSLMQCDLLESFAGPMNLLHTSESRKQIIAVLKTVRTLRYTSAAEDKQYVKRRRELRERAHGETSTVDNRVPSSRDR